MIEINPTIKEWLFAREVMRRLGFAPTEIFFDAYESGQVVNDKGQLVHDFGMPVIGVRVQRGERVWRWTIGPVQMTMTELRAAFDAAVTAWNAGTIDPDKTEFQASYARRDAIQVLAALQDKGFQVSAMGLVSP